MTVNEISQENILVKLVIKIIYIQQEGISIVDQNTFMVNSINKNNLVVKPAQFDLQHNL